MALSVPAVIVAVNDSTTSPTFSKIHSVPDGLPWFVCLRSHKSPVSQWRIALTRSAVSGWEDADASNASSYSCF